MPSTVSRPSRLTEHAIQSPRSPKLRDSGGAVTSAAAKVAQAGVTRELSQQISPSPSRSSIGSPDVLSLLSTQAREQSRAGDRKHSAVSPRSFRPGRTKSRHDLLTRRTGVHDRTHADRAPSASQDMMLSLPPFTTSTQVTRLASKEFGGLREVERQCEKKTRSKQPYEGNNRGKAE